MFFSIKELEVRKIRFAETFEPGRIDFTGAEITQATPLTAEGSATLLDHTGGEVRVKGQYRVGIEACCDRCLGRTVFSLDEKFDLFYRPVDPDWRADEVEIDAGEAEIAFYEGDGFDLADVLKDQVLLALPMQRVCREECLGFCPVCGANRNETACGCSVKPADDRWRALKNISVHHRT